jgi:hypothetical protein
MKTHENEFHVSAHFFFDFLNYENRKQRHKNRKCFEAKIFRADFFYKHNDKNRFYRLPSLGLVNLSAPAGSGTPGAFL